MSTEKQIKYRYCFFDEYMLGLRPGLHLLSALVIAPEESIRLSTKELLTDNEEWWTNAIAPLLEIENKLVDIFEKQAPKNLYIQPKADDELLDLGTYHLFICDNNKGPDIPGWQRQEEDFTINREELMKLRPIFDQILTYDPELEVIFKQERAFYSRG